MSDDVEAVRITGELGRLLRSNDDADWNAALEKIAALVAENQQLRDALEMLLATTIGLAPSDALGTIARESAAAYPKPAQTQTFRGATPMNDDTRTKLEDILIALGNDDIGTARRALFTLLSNDNDEPTAA